MSLLPVYVTISSVQAESVLIWFHGRLRTVRMLLQSAFLSFLLSSLCLLRFNAITDCGLVAANPRQREGERECSESLTVTMFNMLLPWLVLPVLLLLALLKVWRWQHAPGCEREKSSAPQAGPRLCHTPGGGPAGRLVSFVGIAAVVVVDQSSSSSKQQALLYTARQRLALDMPLCHFGVISFHLRSASTFISAHLRTKTSTGTSWRLPPNQWRAPLCCRCRTCWGLTTQRA